MRPNTFLRLSTGPDDLSNRNLTVFMEQKRESGKLINDADAEILELAISDKVATLLPHFRAKTVNELKFAFFHLSSLRKLAKATLLAHENWSIDDPTSEEICAMLNLTTQEYISMIKTANQYRKQAST